MDPKKTVCSYKWNYPVFSFGSSEFKSCCRTKPYKVSDEDIKQHGIDAFINSKAMRESRLDLLQGRKHPDCNKCWQLEDSGALSPRQSANTFIEYLHSEGHTTGTNINEISRFADQVPDINNPVLYSTKPKLLEIHLGNTCDLKCMYCNESFSSQWAVEKLNENQITKEQYNKLRSSCSDLYKETFWQWFDETARYHVERIGIIGGEPLIIPEFYTFVDRFIRSIKSIADKRSSPVVFYFVTNLNTPDHLIHKFITEMKQLPDMLQVEIYVSQEAIESKAEYIRYGLNWQQFTNNLYKLCNSGLACDINIITSHNALSISSTLPILKFIDKVSSETGKSIGLQKNTVTDPTWHSPLILTSDFADYVDAAIDFIQANPRNNIKWWIYNSYLKGLSIAIKSTGTDYTAARKSFYAWHNKYQKLRGVDLYQLFPEYVEFFSFCKQL